MSMFVIQEAAFADSAWGRDVLDGLLQETRRRRMAVTVPDNIEMFEMMTLPDDSVAVIIGAGSPWLKNMIARCRQKVGDRIIVLSKCLHKDFRGEYSFVSSDIKNSAHVIATYLRECGKITPALYGINPHSAADQEVAEYFSGDRQHIFFNDGSLQACFDQFYPQIDRFDAVICANDYAAISLLQRLKEQDYPRMHELFIISYADTMLGSFYSPAITSISVNFKEFGKAALAIYHCMKKEPAFSSINIYVKWQLNTRASTQGIPPADDLASNMYAVDTAEGDRFYNDPEIIEMLGVETLLKSCAEIDLVMLRLLMADKTYDEIAETLYMSTNGVKYKIRNMMALCNTSSKKELITLARKYL